jgi:hypothetical protein
MADNDLRGYSIGKTVNFNKNMVLFAICI